VAGKRKLMAVLVRNRFAQEDDMGLDNTREPRGAI